MINALIAKHHPKPDKNLVGHARYEKLEAYYRKKAYAENTYRSYKSDLKDFINWAEIDLPFPASVTLIKHYILDKADILAPTTLNHRIAALSFIHRYMGVDDPTKDTKVREILSGIRRDRLEDWESAQAPALTLSQIKKLINSIDNDVSGLRDRTLILVGLICAFRQSELSQLRIEWLEKTDDQGYVYRVKRSKTDQDATKRRYKVIPYGSGKMCPVKAIDDLISAMGVDKGPLFRGLSKSDKFLKNAMSHTSVNRIIKKRIGKSGIISDKDPIRCAAKINRYSCHSLRSSFITILRAMEVPDSKIMRQTHHTNINILEMYDRHDMQFKHSPATDFTNGLSNGEGD